MTEAEPVTASVKRVDRRGFVRSVLEGCGSMAAAALLPPLATRRRADPLRLLLVVPAIEPGSVEGHARGVTLGVEEASRTAALVGQRIELVTARGAAGAAREARPSAFLLALEAVEIEEVATLASASGVPLLNLRSRRDALRRESCPRTLFHLEASDRMYEDALAAPGAGAAPAGARATLWHPELERYGAAQLNDRYRARFGEGMDGSAWAGWMGVKIVAEAALRARTAEPAGVRTYLARDATQFDGHKGWPLSFRAGDGQLRQPLYRVDGTGEPGRLLDEVPVRAGEGGPSSRELLDRLGGAPRAGGCATPPEGGR